MTELTPNPNESPISLPPNGAASNADKPEASKGSLLVIFLTVFIDLLGFGIVLPLLPIYADQFGTDPSGFVIGMLMASFSIMQFLFAPVWGALSDRIGRRPVLMLGLLGSVIFYTLFGVAAMYQSLTGLFVTRIGAGIAGATIPTAQAYIADTTSKENRARGMALIGMAFGLGFTLGPLFAYFAVPEETKIEQVPVVASLTPNEESGEAVKAKTLVNVEVATRNPVEVDAKNNLSDEVAISEEVKTGSPGASPGFIAAGLSAIALLLAAFLLPESLSPDSKSAAKKWWDIAAWKSVFQNQAVAFLLIGFFVCIFAFAAFETTLSLLIKGSADFEKSLFDFTFKEVCLTFAAIGLMVAIVQGGIVRRLAKFVSEKNLAIAGAVIEIVGFGMIAYAVEIASVRWLFGSLAVIVTGYSCLQPSLYSLLSRWTDPSQQGKVLGVGQSVSALARIFGSALGIPMLKAMLILPYAVGAVLMLVVAISVSIACRTGEDFEAK